MIKQAVTGPGIEPDMLGLATQCLLADDETIVERERRGQRRVGGVRPLVRDRLLDESRRELVAGRLVTGRDPRPANDENTDLALIDAFSVRSERTHQWIESDGERHEVATRRRPCARQGSERMTRPITRCGGTNISALARTTYVPVGAKGRSRLGAPRRRDFHQHEQRTRRSARRCRFSFLVRHTQQLEGER